MFGRGSKPNTPIDILIGKSARIRGDIDFSGGLHLDGRVMGSVRAVGARDSMLSVSEDGCIEGCVEAVDVVLNGTVRGDIRASERVVLGPRSRVQGDVYYGVIEAALGAEIQGRLVPLREEGAVVAEAETAQA
jgi:cytoskeletal protein CcmA (bactofilin family)